MQTILITEWYASLLSFDMIMRSPSFNTSGVMLSSYLLLVPIKNSAFSPNEIDSSGGSRFSSLFAIENRGRVKGRERECVR